MRLRLAVLLPPLVLFLSAASANAAPRPRHVGVRLEYQRGPRTQQCPDTKDFRAEVAAWLGRDPFTEAGPWRLIAITNRRRDGAFVTTAELFDEKGVSVRSFESMAGRDCSYLLKTVLAERIAAELAEAPAPAPSSDIPAQTVSSPPPSPPQPVPPPTRQWWLGGATGAETGILPTWVPTLSLSLGVRWRAFSLAVEGHTSFPLHGTGEGGVVVHASSGSGALVGCYRGILGGILSLCAVTAAGVFVGGPERPEIADIPWTFLAAGGRVGVEIPGPSKRFAFAVEGDLLYTITPITMVQGDQLVWQSGNAVGGLQAGVRFFL